MKTSTSVIKFINKVAFVCLIGLVFTTKSFAQISVSGGTGLSATYTSLTKSGGLFAALNANAQTGNTITVSITGDVTTEDGANALNAGAWTSITITPSGARTISGTSASTTATTAGLLYFNGADNVTINGLNASGNSLTITNTSVGNSAAILFRNDATNNTITNCNLRGSGVWQRSAVVVFSSGTSTGNDGNTISNCDITGSGSSLPCNGIYSVGTSASVANSGITISGNKIYDYFKADSLNIGIKIDTGNTTHTISNNKIYQTASRTYTIANTHAGINVASANGGNDFTISGNTIGFANSNGTGTYTMAGSVATRFVGIGLSVGSTTASSVQGNTIANFNITSSNASFTTTPTFSGIFINTGNVNVGTTTGNTIGATTGLHSIVCNATGAGGIVGINTASTGIINISTTIGGLTDTSATASNALGITGIYVGAIAASLTVSNCTIGNTTANNIVCGRLGFTTGACSVTGIASVSTSLIVNYNNNTIQNLTGYGAGLLCSKKSYSKSYQFY
jgi:hypothetical protein